MPTTFKDYLNKITMKGGSCVCLLHLTLVLLCRQQDLGVPITLRKGLVVPTISKGGSSCIKCIEKGFLHAGNIKSLGYRQPLKRAWLCRLHLRERMVMPTISIKGWIVPTTQI